MSAIGFGPPPSIDITLSTVTEDKSFDAYLNLAFVGSPTGTSVSLVLDSGNTVLVVPYWEDIEAIPNWQATYTALGQAPEPWGCSANVVRGPIQLITTGAPFVIQDCVFYACTGGDPTDGQRTANFGAGCVQPWSASGWNTPNGVDVTMMSPLAYADDYPLAEFNYAAAADVFSPANVQGVSETSLLRLYATPPGGYQFLKIVPNCSWMSLRPRQLSIDGTLTPWPDTPANAIAMIDSGGTCVFLSDPASVVSASVWPNPAQPPGWAASSTQCVFTQSSLKIELTDDHGTTFTYTVDEDALPPSAQGLTLVMCQKNVYMQDQYGMNIGGLSLLATRLLIDFFSARVGLKSL